jgi:hypothetical protein
MQKKTQKKGQAKRKRILTLLASHFHFQHTHPHLPVKLRPLTTTTRLSPPAAPFSLSLLGRVFKALSPEKPVAATGHHHKSFLYLIFPFFISLSVLYTTDRYNFSRF